jgi:hypothetical protein
MDKRGFSISETPSHRLPASLIRTNPFLSALIRVKQLFTDE